jgi:hypothetical protein
MTFGLAQCARSRPAQLDLGPIAVRTTPSPKRWSAVFRHVDRLRTRGHALLMRPIRSLKTALEGAKCTLCSDKHAESLIRTFLRRLATKK